MALRLLVLALVLGGLSSPQNPTRPIPPADAPVYQEGTVWVIEYARLKEGAAVRYLDALADGWRATLEVARGEGVIVSYKVLLGTAADRHDWDLMTMIELRNMAAIDGLQARLGEVQASPAARRAGSPDLTALREVVGTKIVREAILRPPR
jgi:hypothetical protein